jgi:DNA-directed RNA polymerase subunit K/omega
LAFLGWEAFMQDVAAVLSIPGVSVAQGLGKFHKVTLAFQRARQLQNGARPRVDAPGHRPTRLAMLEVLADTISWTVAAAVV